MNRTILVPIDISDSELTQRVISHVEAEAKIDDAEVHFLTVIPSLPYYDDLVCRIRNVPTPITEYPNSRSRKRPPLTRSATL